MLAIGFHLWYTIDDNLDYEFLHDQIMTNQTFVDNMGCRKIILTDNALHRIISPEKQDQVDILKADFEKLRAECDQEIRK
jgi:hypothetical protein